MSEITDDKIQDYIDGRLSDQDMAAMSAYLLANPKKAREIHELRHQNELLKGIGAEVLTEPVPKQFIDALAKLRKAENTKQRREVSSRRGVGDWTALAATLVAGLCAGWIAHGQFAATPFPSASQLALATARDAYSFYGAEKEFPVEFDSSRDTVFSKWINKTFGREVGRPDFDELGYRYVGARVLPWARGKMGLYLYENDTGGRAALAFWLANDSSRGQVKLDSFDDVLASIYPTDGLDYAVICDKKNKDFERITKTMARYVKTPDI